jgi:hypothetical protein
MTPAPAICGVDFDNTIVSYDELLSRIVQEQALLCHGHLEGKRKIRDRIRQLPDGEIEWQKCQALLYGSRIGEARLIDGVRNFFQRCTKQHVKVYIVSHKTEFSRYDSSRTNLRQAARDWMSTKRFFEPDGLGLSPDAVFFAGTRQEKIDCITELGCTHFIDDLEETFLEETFPQRLTRILYEPTRESAPPPGVRLAKTWQEICDYVFGAA